MSNLQDFYDDYYDAVEKKEKEKEENKPKKDNSWQTAFDSLKKALYEFGYQISAGKEPEVKLNEDLLSKVGSKGFNNDALINTLIEMDNEYRASKSGVSLDAPTLPSTLGLTKKEYVQRTDEDILREVESEILPDYLKNKERATSKIEDERREYEEGSAEAEQELKEESESLLSRGESDLEKHRDNMIFQGLVHSTINSRGATDILNNTLLAKRKIEEEYDRKLTKIKDDLSLAEREFESAIATYELEYALELQTKVNKLKISEEKRREEINNYNKKIMEEEERYQIEREEKLRTLRQERQEALFQEMKREQEMEAEVGVSAEKRLEYAKRKEMALNFYSNYTVEEAKVLIADASEELKNLLGWDEYIDLLKNFL